MKRLVVIVALLMSPLSSWAAIEIKVSTEREVKGERSMDSHFPVRAQHFGISGWGLVIEARPLLVRIPLEVIEKSPYSAKELVDILKEYNTADFDSRLSLSLTVEKINPSRVYTVKAINNVSMAVPPNGQR